MGSAAAALLVAINAEEIANTATTHVLASPIPAGNGMEFPEVMALGGFERSDG